MPGPILIFSTPIAPAEVLRLADLWFGDMVKFVVDLGARRIALGGELYADAEERLLDAGGRQEDLWGGNYYPGRPAGERVEFTALINIRPSQGNRSMELLDPELRAQVGALALALIEGGR
jgi:hypothetical protein